LQLGATALENFGAEVDPIHRRLKPILAAMGGLLASSVPSTSPSGPSSGQAHASGTKSACCGARGYLYLSPDRVTLTALAWGHLAAGQISLGRTYPTRLAWVDSCGTTFAKKRKNRIFRKSPFSICGC